MIDNEKLVAFDIETSNGKGRGALEPRRKGSMIALMQFGFDEGDKHVRGDERNFLHRPDTGLPLLRELIDEGYRFIIHNAFFELDWLLVKHQIPIHKMKVFCTMTASQVLNAGKMIPDKASWVSARLSSKNMDYLGRWNPLMEEDTDNLKIKKNPGRFSHNLQATIYRYLDGTTVEKDQGDSDWTRELTPEQARYALDDVRYLIEVARNQWGYTQKFDLENIMTLEMGLIPATVDMKDNGMKIDLEHWKESAEEYRVEAERLEKELNAKFGRELAVREGQASLFGGVVSRSFKVSSPKKLADFFGLESADEQVLRGIDHPLIPDLLRYKEYFKVGSTYGEGYLKFIGADNRIHSLLIQTEVATGRYSSRKPNLQNIPRDMLKGFLTTDDDMILVTIDYSSVESRILAYAAGDDNYIKSVNSQDVHWENAKKIFDLPENAQRSDVFHVDAFRKTFHGDELRTMSKGVSFGIPYGISAVGLVNRGFAENADQGQDLIDGFLDQYPNVRKFLKRSAIEALSQGYTQDPYGRIRWYERSDSKNQEEVKRVDSMIARRGQNHKIQSMSANVTKRALRDLYYYLSTTGYGRMALTIHDSIFFELHREHAEEAIPEIIRIMEEAGPAILPGMETPVDLDVGRKIKRPCILTGIPFSIYSHLWEDGKIVENPAFIEPRVYKLLKKAGVDTSQDTEILKEELFRVVNGMAEEWQQENKDIVKSVWEYHRANQEEESEELPF